MDILKVTPLCSPALGDVNVSADLVMDAVCVHSYAEHRDKSQHGLGSKEKVQGEQARTQV